MVLDNNNEAYEPEAPAVPAAMPVVGSNQLRASAQMQVSTSFIN